jgi:hypothetical protein
MEYWVAANKSGWAGGGLGGIEKLRKLVDHVGAATWEQFVGDNEKWCNAVWGDYNKLKHDPGYNLDPMRIRVLSLTARVLLQTDLLNAAAQTKRIGRRFLSHYLLMGAKDDLAPYL